MRTTVLMLMFAVVAASAPVRNSERVALVPVPGGGLQPEIAVDADGVVHMVYLAGDAAAADVFYVRSADGARTFSSPVRVNSQPGSAIARGAIRGAQIAIGRGGRIHVAWNGSDGATPQPPVNPKTGRAGMPMLYARSNAAGTAFEPQRNLMTQTTHLDGGGAVAADAAGNVYVGWHAHPGDGEGGEEARRVWIARSIDEGATFAREEAVSDPSTGVCSCCALRMAVTEGDELQLLYRSATDTIHRDIYSLVSRDRGRSFGSERVHEWEIGACPMSSMSIAGRRPVLRAWETAGQVYFERAGVAGVPIAPAISDSNPKPNRKHPRLAAGADGRTLLVWTEGTSFGKGGSLAWQEFDEAGRPTEVKGTRDGIPVWGFAAVVARPDGGYTLLH